MANSAPHESSNSTSLQIPSIPSPDIPLIAPPSPPNTSINRGDDRDAHIYWNQTRMFFDANQTSDFQVTGEKGSLYYETVNFNRIGDMSIVSTTIWGEDYWNTPFDGWYYTVPTNDIIFMAFNISGNAPCKVQGFWVLLYDGTEGPIDYALWAAEPNSTSGHGTRPNLAEKLPFTGTVDVLKVSGIEWRWFDLSMFDAILDSGMTFANTFYVGLSRTAPSIKLHMILVDDTMWPDLDDEGDAWSASMVSPSIDFIPWDFYVDVEITRFPYPSEISLGINGTPVQNYPMIPGIGHLEQLVDPPVNMSGATRTYDVTSTLSKLSFDVTWKGWFVDLQFAQTRFQIWTDKTIVRWNITLFVDFPATAIEPVIYISIEDQWAVLDVLHNGVPVPYSLYYAGSYGWFVKIVGTYDGAYLVLCEAPSILVDVEVWREGQLVTEVNVTDRVDIIGYLQNPSGSPVDNGIAVLDVYDFNDILNYTRGSLIDDPATGRVFFVWDICWSITDAFTPEIYTLFVIWSNGTVAGMNSTTLVIHPMTRLFIHWEFPAPGEPVIRGELIEFLVQYMDHQWHPLNQSDVFVQNDTSMSEWDKWGFLNLKDYFANESYAGLYWIWLETNSSKIDTVHNITLSLVEPPYLEQTYSKSFLVFTNPITIKFLAGSGVIFNHTEGMWRTSPDPYINQTGLQFKILLLDVSGTPIAHATLDPILRWGSLMKHLGWIDLYEHRLGDLGFYQITIDMTPIEGVAFHVGDTPFVQILAKKSGYEEAASDLLHIRPKPRPSFFEIQSQYQNIQLWAGWNYTLPLRVVLRDGLSGEDVSHGNVTVSIPGAGNLLLQLATPGLGLYELPFLDTTNIPSGAHTATFFATASDYVPCTETVTITIQNKMTIGHSVIQWIAPASYYGILELKLGFYFNDVFSSHQKTGMQDNSLLPEGTKVRLEAQGTLANPSILGPTGYIDAEGRITFEVEINHDDYYSFYMTIEGDEEYEGLTNAMIESSPGQPLYIPIRHPFTDIYIRLPWIGLIFVGIAGAIVGYRQYVVIPKRHRRLAEYQAVADNFSDVANLNRLLVLHKESGICVFDPFTDETQDASLVAGFLQAISTFGHDLADSPGLTEGDKEEATTLRELTYEGFRILIHDGAFVRNALVLSGTPSDQIRERLEKFTEKFEERYKTEFKKWEGRVDQFNTALDLVEEIFEVSLRHPHRVALERPSGVQVTSLESDIYKLSKELTKDRDYIFLGQLLSTYLTAAKRDKLEVLMAIYQLRQKELFIPWHINASLSVASTRPPQP